MGSNRSSTGCRGHAERLGEVAKRFACFHKNIHDMRYGECRARDMPVGSGVMEGGRGSVVRGRVRKGGAPRTMKEANGVMAPGCRSPINRMTDPLDWCRTE